MPHAPKYSRPSRRKRGNSGRSKKFVQRVMQNTAEVARLHGEYIGLPKGTYVTLCRYPTGEIVPRITVPSFEKVKRIPLTPETNPLERAIGESIQRYRLKHPFASGTFTVKRGIRSGARDMRVASPAEIMKIDDVIKGRTLTHLSLTNEMREAWDKQVNRLQTRWAAISARRKKR